MRSANPGPVRAVLLPLGLAVAVVLVAGPGPAHPQAAPRGDHVDTLHDVRVPDPYRWMEEMEAQETRRWVEGQDRRARNFAENVESRAALREQVSELADVRRYRPPWKRGGRYFYLTFRSSGGPGTTGTQLHVREGLEGGDGAERTLLSQENLPEGTVLTRIVPGPDGRLVAYGVARDGSRWETLRVFDVERGRPLDDRLEGVNTGASKVAWAPDGRGFYYERFDVPDEAEARTARLEDERVLHHAVGTDQEKDRTVLTASAADRGLTVGLGDDGRWLVVTERDPDSGGHRVLVADRRRDETAFHPLVDEASASYRLVGGEDDALWFETDRDAPNRKVVAVDLSAVAVAADAATAPGNSPSGGAGAPAWRDAIPEAEEAINGWLGARRVGRHLIVGYLVDARTEWRVFDLDGRPLYTVDLPRLGPVWSGFQPSVEAEETETFYSLSGLADPGSIYRLDLETGRSTLFARPELGHDPDEFVTRQVFYEGRDGTRIPMYLVHRRGLERDGRAPVIMYGYGFGGWSAAPWFQPHLAAWLRMGGMWALPRWRPSPVPTSTSTPSSHRTATACGSTRTARRPAAGAVASTSGTWTGPRPGQGDGAGPRRSPVRPEPRNPLVGPDGSFLVFTASGPDGSTDLFVTCRRDGGWSDPIHLPRPVNSPYMDFAPGLDPADGSLLFTSERPGMAGPQPDSVRPPGDLYRSSLRPAELCRGTPGAVGEATTARTAP